MSAERNVVTVATFLRLLERGDIEAWIGLWALHAEQHYPFGTTMFPPHIVGRDAIYRHWRDLPAQFTTMSFPLRDTWVDGDTVLARFDGECVRDGAPPYRNHYLGVFRFDRDGLIRSYSEYFDPILAAEAFGLAEVRYHGSTVP